MRVGVNYTPSHGWFHSWLDLDLDSTRRDFEAIAGLGLDHVRIFPLWPLLQPNRTLVRPRALDEVAAVAEVAGEFDLQVSVDGLNGHLSSFDFLPSWLVTWHRANLFTGAEAISGEETLLTRLAERLAVVPNVTGMTVGNEFAQFAACAPGHTHPARSGCTVDQAEEWLSRVIGAIRSGMPDAGAWFGFDDDLWFVDDHPFTPDQAVRHGDATTVHSWVFSRVGPRFGSGHPALAWFSRYLVELARAWSPDPSRPIWLQEVGAPRTHVRDEDAADFLTTTVSNLLDSGIQAITWWCSHDVSPDLADFPDLEYSLGLFTSRGRPKPEALALSEMIADLHRAEPGRPSTTVEIAVDRATGIGRSACSPSGSFFDQWVRAAEESGTAPAIRVVDAAEGRAARIDTAA